MKTKIIASAVTAIATLAAVNTAHACPAGYEAVWIQGNKVCKFAGVAGNDTLRANPRPGVDMQGGNRGLKAKRTNPNKAKRRN